MTIQEIRDKISSTEYDFLRTDEHLKDNICILALGGSNAYGTSTKNSDLDIRGIIVPSAKDIIMQSRYDQFENKATDTVIYSLNKIIDLLLNCNPNTIEILGTKPEHYIQVSKYGQMILDNKQLFLSKKCINSFGGYATAQLRRLQNKAIRDIEQSEKEKHILDSINTAKHTFADRYPIDFINMYIDESNSEDLDTEIYFDIALKHFPMRDYCGMMSEMQNIISSYNKIGSRNSKAQLHSKIGKHMMHLIRIYLMCIDLLEKGQIITYRENDIELLMQIRNEDPLFIVDGQPTPAFYELLESYKKRFDYAVANTCLPDKPNNKQVDELKYSIYSDIVKNM